MNIKSKYTLEKENRTRCLFRDEHLQSKRTGLKSITNRSSLKNTKNFFPKNAIFVLSNNKKTIVRHFCFVQTVYCLWTEVFLFLIKFKMHP